jgi:hypothetical protein
MNEQLKSDLSGLTKDFYGQNYDAHILEQYKIYLEMIDRVSARRQLTNSFFLTITTAMITMLGIVWPKAVGPVGTTWYIIIGLAGLMICYCWYRLVKSYRDLNTSKFLILHAIEERLPLRPYSAEWKLVGAGKNEVMYLPFTHIETAVPWVFFFLFMGLIILAVCSRGS